LQVAAAADAAVRTSGPSANHRECLLTSLARCDSYVPLMGLPAVGGLLAKIDRRCRLIIDNVLFTEIR